MTNHNALLAYSIDLLNLRLSASIVTRLELSSIARRARRPRPKSSAGTVAPCGARLETFATYLTRPAGSVRGISTVFCSVDSIVNGLA